MRACVCVCQRASDACLLTISLPYNLQQTVLNVNSVTVSNVSCMSLSLSGYSYSYYKINFDCVGRQDWLDRGLFLVHNVHCAMPVLFVGKHSSTNSHVQRAFKRHCNTDFTTITVNKMSFILDNV